jgi:hypothetical protein
MEICPPRNATVRSATNYEQSTTQKSELSQSATGLDLHSAVARFGPTSWLFSIIWNASGLRGNWPPGGTLQNRNNQPAISAGASWINKMQIGIALGRLSALR